MSGSLANSDFTLRYYEKNNLDQQEKNFSNSIGAFLKGKAIQQTGNRKVFTSETWTKPGESSRLKSYFSLTKYGKCQFRDLVNLPLKFIIDK